MQDVILYREYSDYDNTVTGAANSKLLSGEDTNFTSLCVGVELVIDDYGSVGRIQTILSDTSLVLENKLTSSFTGKKYYVDLTLFKSSVAEISKKLESETKGEASVITLDSVNMEFYMGDIIVAGFTIANPVAKLFSDISSKRRCVIKKIAQAKLNKYSIDEVSEFEGVVDFSTIKKTSIIDENGEQVLSTNFDVLDKLSALSILQNELQRGDSFDALAERGPSNATSVFWIAGYNADLGGAGTILRVIDVQNPKFITQTQTLVLAGETIRLGDNKYFVQHSALIHETLTGGTDQYEIYSTFVKLTESSSNTAFQPDSAVHLICWVKEYLGQDLSSIVEYDSNNNIQRFNGLGFIAAMIKKQWPDAVLINKSGYESLPLPLFYFDKLIDEYPFGKETLEALSFLAETNGCYLYQGDGDNFILQGKANYDNANPALDIIISKQYIKANEYSAFWDKLADAVELNVTGWQDDITGKGYAVKREGIKPRNKMAKDVFVDIRGLNDNGITINSDGSLTDPTVTDNGQEEILNHYGNIKADEVLDFYGKRHIFYEIVFNSITWEMRQWSLMNIFRHVEQPEFAGDANNGRYFPTAIKIDDTNNTLTLELVSISRIVYDSATILNTSTDDTTSSSSSSSSSSGSSSSGGGTTVTVEGRYLIKNISSNYSLTLQENMILCNASTGSIQITLPSGVKYKNVEYLISKTDQSSNSVTILGTCGGIANPVLYNQYQQILIKYDGSLWVVIDELSYFRESSDLPYGNISPLFKNEKIFHTTGKTWYRSVGLLNTDWVRETSAHKSITTVNPNGSLSPDYIMQELLATPQNAETVLWKAIGTANTNWARLIYGINADIPLAPLPGGVVKVRKYGATDESEIQMSHDGANGIIESKKGDLRLKGLTDDAGNKYWNTSNHPDTVHGYGLDYDLIHFLNSQTATFHIQVDEAVDATSAAQLDGHAASEFWRTDNHPTTASGYGLTDVLTTGWFAETNFWENGNHPDTVHGYGLDYDLVQFINSHGLSGATETWVEQNFLALSFAPTSNFYTSVESYQDSYNIDVANAENLGGHSASYFQQALGFTPYDASNPLGFATSSWSNDTFAANLDLSSDTIFLLNNYGRSIAEISLGDYAKASALADYASENSLTSLADRVAAIEQKLGNGIDGSFTSYEGFNIGVNGGVITKID